MTFRTTLSACLSVYLILSLSLAPASAQQSAATGEHEFDGPAELPRLHVRSAMADTPAHGRTLQVRAGEDLQAVLNDIHCGDTLKLQAGATFDGVFRFPNKPCDDLHWIIVRTSAPDETLPPEGTRITPCYGGTASLPGRPELHCASPRSVLAKIELDRKTDAGPILFLAGANHYRFLGLEITRTVPQLHMRNLVQPQDANTTAHHLVFDRLWLHGTPQDETKGGIHLSGTTNVAIVDSYFSDFHCIALKGSCTDAQAINGGGGNAPGGPYKIEDNFLEASGESILFGGAPGTSTPADIEILRNHLFKPMVWKPGEPGFVGAYTGNPFIVKNNFELKNAQRVLFEGNILENCWGGFSQAGFSIVLTPANQNDQCPLCRVTDVTIRYNKIISVGSAINIANVAPRQQRPSSGGERYSIHDLLVEDIKGEAFQGFGLFALLISAVPPLKDVRFDHITAFPLRSIFSILNTGEKLPGFSLTNSIFAAGQLEIRGTGGGRLNCTSGFQRIDTAGVLNNCFAHPVVSRNLIIGGIGKWPAHNIVVSDDKDAGLWKTADDTNRKYRVCAGKQESQFCRKISPAYRSATDGKDIGADIRTIENATRGVI